MRCAVDKELLEEVADLLAGVSVSYGKRNCTQYQNEIGAKADLLLMRVELALVRAEAKREKAA